MGLLVFHGAVQLANQKAGTDNTSERRTYSITTKLLYTLVSVEAHEALD